ncbi:type II toxin-antitoxin system VapC family toxin [Acidaminobacter hydrogenoformans]|uniref:PIN domain-containing protein n=1 Tax=Acidaminobacter hydrogenoformans DSM 2784 TaxID=1120920 RepID=A0A1G5S258_9FIRM|nr:type II toxin-antitoxin system VapC family toxin [Acidaminobacter hydrogenoformans]SCZ80482.1 hypothetical protein SAMN03080599_02293 [Acidaminobacter hydrogenoformans DSM 2784]
MFNDIKNFNKNSVIDSCSVINVVSSETLFQSAKIEKCKFIITTYIEYELLKKSRGYKDKDHEIRAFELDKRIEQAIETGEILKYSLDISDLLDPLVNEHKRGKSRGELTAIILAKKFNVGLFTDDKKAQKIASDSLGVNRVESLYSLIGWLTWSGLLNDAEKESIITQHKYYFRDVSKCVEKGFVDGLMARLT